MATRKLTISIWEEPGAPNTDRWSACWDEYDEGRFVAYGPTPADAVRDLVDMTETERGDLPGS